MGLESIYNKQLTGTDGKLTYQRDARNYLLPNSSKNVQEAQHGNDIYLTLDKTIQNFLEDAMNRVNAKYSPQSMIGVVANPKTGEILAMSQRPTFNPDTREGLDGNWLNDVVENTIEPRARHSKPLPWQQQWIRAIGFQMQLINQVNTQFMMILSEIITGMVGERFPI